MKQRKKRVKRTDKVINEILEGLDEGRTLTAVCEDDGMPTIRAVQKWRREDKDLDDDFHRAWTRGLQIQRDKNFDVQQSIIANPDKHDPKTIQAVATITRDVAHNVLALLSKLDNRYKDKQQVEHTGPLSISWDENPKHVEEKNPDALLALTTTPTGGEERKH